MEGELQALIKVSVYIIASMTYGRLAAASTNPGNLRLLSLLPITILLPLLPLHFSSLHLRIISAFFLAWLGVFKLLLLSFGVGPLSPSLPLSTFIAISSLPLKLRPPNSPPSSKKSEILVPTFIKSLLLASLISFYQYRSRFPRPLVLTMYCLHIYLALDFILASTAFFAGSLLNLDLEPQFDAPLKSISLQEFWGQRWNLMVTGILRPSVYHPIRSRHGTAAGFIAVFLVSGLMHEVMFWYVTLEGPTGEVTLFFFIHGVCTVAEMWARRAGWWSLPPAVAVPVTLGFVMVTGLWLFFPPALRGGAEERTIEECVEMVRYFQEGGWAIFRRLMGDQK